MSANDVNINKETEKTVRLIKELFNEIERLVHFKINSLCDKDEIEKLYVKVNFADQMCFEISLFNSETNTVVIKNYDALNLITLCQLGMINATIDLDVKELYKKSKFKKYNDLTKIVLD